MFNDDYVAVDAAAIRDAVCQDSNNLYDIRDSLSVESVFESLQEEITAFNASIDDSKEVCIRIANFGKTTDLIVTRVYPREPSLICFEGFTTIRGNTQLSTLIQHVNQLNFLMYAAPRLAPEEPKRPIGFIAPRPGK